MRRAAAPSDAGYRRGLVLGLTMAELMLLLVFCLLIALAALMTNERKKTSAAEDNALRAEERAEAAVLDAAEFAALGPEAPLAPETPISDDWRRLVRDGTVVADLARAGLSPEVLVRNRDFLAAVAPLGQTMTAAEVRDAVAFAERVRSGLALAPDAPANEALGRIAEAEAAARAARPGRAVDLPPILILREDRGFTFETGSAVPAPAFVERLTEETAPELARLIEDYDVDVVEVIGHTDDRRVATGTSNLDDTLFAVARGAPVAAMTASDNAGLGLARAAAVAQILRADPRLAGRQILPFSAGPLIGTDDRLTPVRAGGDEPERRRIEIRLRRATLPE